MTAMDSRAIFRKLRGRLQRRTAMTRLTIVAAAGLLTAGLASAQAPDWSHPRRVDVTLSNFDFTPSSIHLKAGEPTDLHIVNASGSRHNFSAKAFFAAASMNEASKAAVRDGTVEVPGKGTIDIVLIPRAGRYKLKCTHTFHTTFGMKGEIIVD